jgi:hypothetical protein
MAGDSVVWDVWLDIVLYCSTGVLFPRPPPSARLLKLRATGERGKFSRFFGPLALV